MTETGGAGVRWRFRCNRCRGQTQPLRRRLGPRNRAPRPPSPVRRDPGRDAVASAIRSSAGSAHSSRWCCCSSSSRWLPFSPSSRRDRFARSAGAFLGRSSWDPVQKDFGALPFIYGTLVSSFLALLQAVPLAIGTALFLTELAPSWLRAPVAFLVELLATIPSVVYGLWGIFVLVPWVRSIHRARTAGHARISAALPRAELRRRHAHRLDHSGDHDRAVHHVGRA